MNLPVKLLSKAAFPLLAMGLAGLLMSCGNGTYVDKRTRGDSPLGQFPGQKKQTDKPGSEPVDDSVPLDTFLDSPAIPSRLKRGSELSFQIKFRSNLASALFECKTSKQSVFTPCPDGPVYTFSGLVHGRGYTLHARSVINGRVDQSPLIVSFILDNVDGLPLQEPETVPDMNQILQPVSPSELPMPLTAGAGHFETRKLQIGSMIVLDVPDDFLVTSYATTKTYNNAMHLMRIMGTDTGTSLFADEPCNRVFERLVAGPSAFSYCDATPTRQQWQDSYAARIPFNHVEVVKNGATGPSEKFFVAAFDEEQTRAGSSIGIDSLCRGAVSRGQTRGPIAQGFFDGQTLTGIINWCQVKDRQGRWWWLGSADVDISTNGSQPGTVNARIIYTLAHQPAVYSGQRFATRFSERSTRLLSKLSAE